MLKPKSIRPILFGVVLASIFAVTLAVNSLAASGAQHGESDIYRIADRSQIDGAWATLTTNPNGANMTFHTRDLTPGDVVTIWWIVFNNPEYCEHGVPGESRCGIFDLLPRGGNPAIDTSVLYAAGHVVGGNGRGNFGGHLSVGDTSGANFGSGLVNPLSAEIHLVARTHGQVIQGRLAEQINSYNGGCDVNHCEDFQAAIFEQ